MFLGKPVRGLLPLASKPDALAGKEKKKKNLACFTPPMLTADCMGHDSVSCPVLLCQCPSDLGIPGGEGTSVHDCFGLFFSSVRFHIVLV